MEIRIPCHIYEKIFYWIDKADFEVSGFGTAIFNGTDFIVTDITLPKQEGSSAMTDIDAQALSIAQYKLREAPGTLCFWWHSHVNMKAYMSSTDDDTIKMIAKNGLCLAVVFNKSREYHGVVSYPCPFGGDTPAYIANVIVRVEYPALTDAEKASAELEYTTNVTEKTYRSTNWNKNDEYEYGGYWQERYGYPGRRDEKDVSQKNLPATITAEEAAMLAEFNDLADDLPDDDTGPDEFFSTFDEIKEANALNMSLYQWRSIKTNASKKTLKKYKRKLRVALGDDYYF